MNPEITATLDASVNGVDAAAKNAEAVWGYERLPDLVSQETRVKFELAKTRWRVALDAAYGSAYPTQAQVDAVVAYSQTMMRAWPRLIAEATERGFKPIDPDVWETTCDDGSLLAVVRTSAEANHVASNGRYRVVLTMAEVAHLFKAAGGPLAQIKSEFPKAEIVAVKSKAAGPMDDEIPF